MSQQIYIPLGGHYPIPYEYEADCMQVPRGKYSVLWELRDGNITSAEAMILLTLNHGSTWNSGNTWGFSGQTLSKNLGKGMSRSYVVKVLASLTDKGWIQTTNTDNPLGYQYRIRHHLCDPHQVPVDRDDKPLKFAVPRGPGGPLERCFEGDISWKAALAWISLKLRSNWKANQDTSGQTEAATLLELSRRIRMKNAGYQKVITELAQAGMLQRLSPKSQPAIFQLFPKPFPRETAPTPQLRREWVKGKEMTTDAEDKHWYADNQQYRCSREYPHAIEKRQRGGTWKRISEFEKYQEMPSAILRDFERAIEFKRDVDSVFES